MDQLKELFRQTTGLDVATSEPLAGSGSNRQYYRLHGTDGTTFIGVVGTSRDENRAFCYLANHFAQQQLPVPAVLAQSADLLRYLQTDLGDLTLYQKLQTGREAGGRYNQLERQLLHRTIALLPDLQIRGARGLDFSQCYPQEALDETNVLFDLNYFKYCFLKPAGLDFHELKLEATFRLMARDIVSIPGEAFMYRDFQARNIMLDADGQPHFIDFQGGRRGPVHYDLASFLWQASARYPDALRQELIDTYIESLSRYREVDEPQFRAHLRLCVLFRLLQVLGAYGFRGYFERKQYFIDSIPPALQNLRQLLEHDGCPYPYLRDLLTQLVRLPRFARPAAEPTPRADGYRTAPSNPYAAHPQDGPATFSKYDGKGPLVVRVYSFSFHKGIPHDESGNGGGYVFDCRSTHNPGRYEPYKQLTGLDEPVIRFLEDDGEILTFLQHVYALADAHVARYLQRGFTHLMFSFGCTGGQHRSVYSAQHLAEHLHRRFGIEVHIVHREQGIHQTLLPAAPRRAMILAAGLGSRLRPLTDHLPKALVPVAGKPLLQHQLEKLHEAGIPEAIVNLHHHADQIEDWCADHPSPVRVLFSDERAQLLDTGGALKHALPLLRDMQQPLLVHNVDILSNARFEPLLQAAEQRAALLLVSERPSRRQLLFDDDMRLVGWTDTQTRQLRSPYPRLDASRCHHLAFAGIHAIHPRLFSRLRDYPEDCFSIIDFYLQACTDEPIYGFVQPGLRLLDVGKPESLRQAETFLGSLRGEQ